MVKMDLGNYAYYRDYCKCTGCLVFLGLVDESGDEAGSYPVNVYNVNDVLLGVAHYKGQFASIWNSDPVNQAVGVLSGWYGPFSFLLNTADCNGTVPEFLGLGGGGDFTWFDDDFTSVIDFDDTTILFQ